MHTALGGVAVEAKLIVAALAISMAAFAQQESQAFTKYGCEFGTQIEFRFWLPLSEM